MPFVLFSPLAPVPVCLATSSNQVMMIVTCYSTFVVVLAYKLPNYYYLDSASHRTLYTIYRVSFC